MTDVNSEIDWTAEDFKDLVSGGTTRHTHNMYVNPASKSYHVSYDRPDTARWRAVFAQLLIAVVGPDDERPRAFAAIPNDKPAGSVTITPHEGRLDDDRVVLVGYPKRGGLVPFAVWTQ